MVDVLLLLVFPGTNFRLVSDVLRAEQELVVDCIVSWKAGRINSLSREKSFLLGLLTRLIVLIAFQINRPDSYNVLFILAALTSVSSLRTLLLHKRHYRVELILVVKQFRGLKKLTVKFASSSDHSSTPSLLVPSPVFLTKKPLKTQKSTMY